MFEVRNVADLREMDPPFMTAVDGIRVPVRFLDQAESLADEHKKTFFIGIVEKYEPSRNERLELMDVALAALRPAGMYTSTGEYVISDDRDAVLAHGCGRLVWVTPKYGPTIHDKLNHLVDVLTAETTAFGGDSAKNANAAQLMTICGNLLAQTNFFDEGHALTAKALEIEKAIKELGE